MTEPFEQACGGPRPIRAEDLSPLLALNNAHAAELSFLAPDELALLVDRAFLALRSETEAAFLLAFDQDAAYASPNFFWMRDRFDRFVYVDRVVVAPKARGRGLARQLYAAVFAAAARSGHCRVVCEINCEPPNPVSDAFHATMGFDEIGRASIHAGVKLVRYLERPVVAGDATVSAPGA